MSDRGDIPRSPRSDRPRHRLLCVGLTDESSQRVRELFEVEHDLVFANDDLEGLQSAKARTRAIVESALDGIVLLAMDGTIEGLNASAERIFGRGLMERGTRQADKTRSAISSGVGSWLMTSAATDLAGSHRIRHLSSTGGLRQTQPCIHLKYP